MDAAFNLQTEVANLARRIVGPVAAKVAQKEFDTAVGHIRHAFEQLNCKGAGANVDFENMAVNILEPMRAKLSEANFLITRSRGATCRRKLFCSSFYGFVRRFIGNGADKQGHDRTGAAGWGRRYSIAGHSFYADKLVLAGGDCLTRKMPSLRRRTFTVYTGRIGVQSQREDRRRKTAHERRPFSQRS